MIESESLLLNKKIIINGASKGIGRAVAIGFAELGATVGLISRNEKLLKENIKFIRSKGGTAYYRVADVSKFNQLKNAMEGLIKEMGGIDVLVNNAGIAKPHFIPESVEEIDQILDINLKGVIYGIYIALPYFQDQKKGSIISTSSGSSMISTLKMINNNALYAASKAGINLFSFSISQELSKRIKVNVILPGWVRTDIVAVASKNAIENLAKHFDVAEPEDIVPFYTYYASDESKRVSGAIVNLPLMRMAVRFFKEKYQGSLGDWNEMGYALENYSRSIHQHVKDHVNLMKFLLTVDAKGASMMPR
ncbi:MAG: SDR family oxidoreductase [Candidatus Lokiarchaeota archaeon]|nr:SDR family oxidoreductase [Candidatus Lokiarchaeota archaeon]